MRLLRLAVRWKLLVALASSGAVAVLVSGALASPRQPAAGVAVQFQLVSAPTCDSETKRLGRACVDRPEIPGWTIGDGSAQWNNPGQWQTSYRWTIPTMIPSAGAPITLNVTGQELTKNPNARICPAIGVSGRFTFKGGATQLLKCAESGQSANGALKLTLVPPSAAAGTTVSLTVGIQDGPGYKYTYRAVTTQKRCRLPKRVDAAAADCTEVRFAFSHGGRPRGAPEDLLDMTTNGAGRADLGDPKGRGVVTIVDVVVRVVRTVEYVNPKDVPPVLEAGLVFGPGEGPGKYLRNVRVAVLSVPLQLVSSNDPECPMPRRGREATLTLVDWLIERGPQRDELRLSVTGCPEHAARFIGRGPGRKPLVRVVITEK